MSIVNEALKKAAKGDTSQRGEDKRVLSFSTKTSHVQALLLRILPVLFLVLLIAYVFNERKLVVQWWSGLRSTPTVREIPSAGTGPVNVQSSPVKAKPAISPPPQAETERLAEAVQRLKLGNQFFQNRKFMEAEEEFRRVILLQPTNAMAYNNLGLVLKAEGRVSDAEAQYLTALQMNPNFPEALNNLGLLYDQQGRIQEAVQQYRKAIEISPNYPEAHLNFAQVLERAGYLEEARRHYQAFLTTGVAVSPSLRRRVQQHLENLP
jgi:tetratricopeptide (TPR) repeat protein